MIRHSRQKRPKRRSPASRSFARSLRVEFLEARSLLASDVFTDVLIPSPADRSLQSALLQMDSDVSPNASQIVSFDSAPSDQQFAYLSIGESFSLSVPVSNVLASLRDSSSVSIQIVFPLDYIALNTISNGFEPAPSPLSSLNDSQSLRIGTFSTTSSLNLAIDPTTGDKADQDTPANMLVPNQIRIDASPTERDWMRYGGGVLLSQTVKIQSDAEGRLTVSTDSPQSYFIPPHTSGLSFRIADEMHPADSSRPIATVEQSRNSNSVGSMSDLGSDKLTSSMSQRPGPVVSQPSTVSSSVRPAPIGGLEIKPHSAIVGTAIQGTVNLTLDVPASSWNEGLRSASASTSPAVGSGSANQVQPTSSDQEFDFGFRVSASRSPTTKRWDFQIASTRMQSVPLLLSASPTEGEKSERDIDQYFASTETHVIGSPGASTRNRPIDPPSRLVAVLDGSQGVREPSRVEDHEQDLPASKSLVATLASRCIAFANTSIGRIFLVSSLAVATGQRAYRVATIRNEKRLGQQQRSALAIVVANGDGQ